MTQPIWKSFHMAFAQTAATMNGTFIDQGLEEKGVLVQHKGWSILIDTIEIQGNIPVSSPDPFALSPISRQRLRLRAAFNNPSNIHFEIYPEGLSEKFDKAFGGQDLQVGLPEFDEIFVIKGKQSDVISSMLKQTNLPTHLLQTQVHKFKILNEPDDTLGCQGKHVNILYLEAEELASRTPDLTNLLDIASLTLNHLVKLSLIPETKPQSTLVAAL